jgi:hypothetical protein
MSYGVQAQSEYNSQTVIEDTQDLPKDLPKAKVGTYQFIVHDSKVIPAFINEILYFVEKERKQSEDVVVPISEHVDLYIPSKDKINSETFEPLEEVVL